MNDPLYRKSILRLAAAATGAGRLSAPGVTATRHNPACGDRITMDLALAGGRIAALGYHAHACVLAQASASILGESATGCAPAELAILAEGVRRFLAGGPPPLAPFEAYQAFEGFAAHAGRHRCVLMPLEAALDALGLLERTGAVSR